MYIPKIVRSKELYKPHITIIASVSSHDDIEIVAEELKKAVRKMNRQVQRKVSYEIFIECLKNA